MQDEKQYLASEVGTYFDRTDYVIFADYTAMTVADVEELRRRLAAKGAEFHVIKNRIFRRVAEDRGVRNVEEWLSGQTGVIFGGPAVGDVIKLLDAWTKDKNKLPIKGGIVGKSGVSADDLRELTKLPPIEVLKAQFLGLLSQPATKLVTLLNTPGTQMVTVLGAPAQNLASVLSQRQFKLEHPSA